MPDRGPHDDDGVRDAIGGFGYVILDVSIYEPARHCADRTVSVGVSLSATTWAHYRTLFTSTSRTTSSSISSKIAPHTAQDTYGAANPGNRAKHSGFTYGRYGLPAEILSPICARLGPCALPYRPRWAHADGRPCHRGFVRRPPCGERQGWSE